VAALDGRAPTQGRPYRFSLFSLLSLWERRVGVVRASEGREGEGFEEGRGC